MLKLSFLRRMEISYEELLADVDLFSKLCSFLQIEPPESIPDSGIAKRRTGNLEDFVTNIDEVRASLAGSEFAYLLDEKPRNY